jgi:electron transfer flavoprotein beta subunit
LNIVVCIKQVLDTQGPVNVDNEGGIDGLRLSSIVNPSDLVAVEEALQLKERYGFEQVIAVSMGSLSAEEALRECLAIGADKAVLLCDPAFQDSDSHATALALTKAIRHMGCDLVLCGQRAIDTEAGQVGFILAHMLNMPMISAVTKVYLTPDLKQAIAHRKLEKGNREVVEAPLPLLLAVDIGLNSPRHSDLRGVIAARRAKIEKCDCQSLGINPEEVGAQGSKVTMIKRSRPRPKPKKVFTPDSKLSAAERMRLVMSGGVQEKKGDMLQGNPEDIASQLVRFLVEQKIITS